MLDKKTNDVLRMLQQQVGYGFKVVKKQLLLQALPPRSKIDEARLIAAVAYLKENDFAVVKYQDKEDICLCLTTKAQAYLEGESFEKHAGNWWLWAGVFTLAFLGALLGTLIGKLL